MRKGFSRVAPLGASERNDGKQVAKAEVMRLRLLPTGHTVRCRQGRDRPLA